MPRPFSPSPRVNPADTTINNRVPMDGVARCARYAFGPNKLHLCGPDMNQEVLNYLNEGLSDQGLTNILQQFNTLYPYLAQIAHANHLSNPFDHQVVEAYWLGNRLLDNVRPQVFYRHLKENLRLPKRLTGRQMSRLTAKLSRGALMHHSFHVMNIWQRTGHDESTHTLDSIDKCRVSWGQIISVNGPTIKVKRRPLIWSNNQLALDEPVTENIIRHLAASSDFDHLSPGQNLSIHWQVPCEIITDRQLANLNKYTALSITLANQTI